MLFFSKRKNVSEHSSSAEACISILGFFLAIGLVGGLGVLIYGLVKGNLSATISGGVTFGVSVFFSIVLALVYVYCLKNNDVNSNVNEQQSYVTQRQRKRNHHRKQNRQVKREQSSSHEISVISGVHKSNNYPQKQQQSNGYDIKKFSPPIQIDGLSDSTHFGYGKQIPPSPSKTSSFAVLNQSNSSINNQNYQSSINVNTKRNYYDRH